MTREQADELGVMITEFAITNDAAEPRVIVLVVDADAGACITAVNYDHTALMVLDLVAFARALTEKDGGTLRVIPMPGGDM